MRHTGPLVLSFPQACASSDLKDAAMKFSPREFSSYAPFSHYYLRCCATSCHSELRFHSRVEVWFVVMGDFIRWRRPRHDIFPSPCHRRLLYCFNITIRASFAITCCLEISLSRRFQVWYDPVPNFGCGGILLYSRATSSLMELRPKCRFSLF